MVVNRKKLFRHKFTEDGITYIVRLPDIYEGNGSNIGTALGIDKVASDYEMDSTDQPITVKSGLQNGRLVRMRISYSEGGKNKRSLIICPVGKVNQAISSILAKNFEGNNITSAGFPTRRRLG